MSYFSDAYNDFFKGLAANNHRDWFHENKKTYDKEVKKAFATFLTDLIAAIRDRYEPNLDLEPKNAVFRINRDIRFSKDKTPYKLHMSAVVSQGGRKNMQIPGMYIQLGVGEIWVGGGMYAPDKENLLRIRQHIAANPKKVDALLKDKAFLKMFPKGIEGDANKRIPKEFKATFEIQPLVANKQWYFMALYDDEDLIKKEDLIDWILEHYEAARKWNAFFEAAMK